MHAVVSMLMFRNAVYIYLSNNDNDDDNDNAVPVDPLVRNTVVSMMLMFRFTLSLK